MPAITWNLLFFLIVFLLFILGVIRQNHVVSRFGPWVESSKQVGRVAWIDGPEEVNFCIFFYHTRLFFAIKKPSKKSSEKRMDRVWIGFEPSGIFRERAHENFLAKAVAGLCALEKIDHENWFFVVGYGTY